MKSIPLSQNKFALVDDADYEYLNQWKWYARKGRYTFYAQRNGKAASGAQTIIQMHRVLLNAKKGELIDHNDRNGLNNRRNNIRFATASQNSINRKPWGKSSYRGVCWNKELQKWEAQGMNNGKRINLGRFAREKQAARAYNVFAEQHYGTFASLNVV